MLALFLFGTFWFWVLTACLLVWLLVCVFQEKGGLSTVALVTLVLFLEFAAKVPVFGWIVAHPLLFAGGIVAYLILGTMWGTFKWGLYLRKQAYRFSVWTKTATPEMKSKLTAGNYYTCDNGERFEFNPQVSKHKSDVTFWMTYWPFSVITFVLGDVIRKIFNHIFYAISGRLQKMSDKAFGVTKKDIQG